MFSSLVRSQSIHRSFSARLFSSTAASFDVSSTSLRGRLEELVPVERERVKKVKQEHGDKQLGTCTVEQAYGGMRSVKSMVWETSLLDPEEGIRFRGLSLPECQKRLPAFA